MRASEGKNNLCPRVHVRVRESGGRDGEQGELIERGKAAKLKSEVECRTRVFYCLTGTVVSSIPVIEGRGWFHTAYR